MKKFLLFSLTFMMFSVLHAHPWFNAGVKGGITVSSLKNYKEYIAENSFKYHIGAFGRVGWDRIYVQPEVYFNSRGGHLKSSANPAIDAVENFDFSSVDVPVLAGVKVIKKESYNVRVMAGPMFGFLTSRDVEPIPTLEQAFSEDYFNDHLFGWQFGVGFEYKIFSLDVRMERSRNSVYESDDFTTNNNLFLASFGIKIL
jgi:hypothetical protein